MPRSGDPVRPLPDAGNTAIAAAAITAAAANAKRHPTVSATSGTAKPASSVDKGMAACLAPNAKPWRATGTSLASRRFAAGCPAALAKPPTTSITGSSHHTRTNSATAMQQIAAIKRAIRICAIAPIRCTK